MIMNHFTLIPIVVFIPVEPVFKLAITHNNSFPAEAPKP